MKLIDIRNFFEGNLNYIKLQSSFLSLEEHIQEQAIYRAALCYECLQLGKCKICNCKAPEMFYAPRKVDSKGRWKEMLSREDWEDFKLQEDLEIPDTILELFADTDADFFKDAEFTSAPWDLQEFMDKIKKKVDSRTQTNENNLSNTKEEQNEIKG